jgi:hypothetical protein
MYNMVMGRNPAFGYLMAMVGINKENARKAGRVRDVWITEDAKTIGVLHRNYGEEGKEANDFAASLPRYREFALDDFDGTYGWWLFDVAEEHLPLAQEIAQVTDNENCMVRYRQLIDDLGKGVDNEMTQQAMKAGEKIAEGLGKAFEKGESTTVETEDGSVDIISGKDIIDAAKRDETD